MLLPTPADVLAEAERALAGDGRVALCQIIATQGSTPGKSSWKLLMRPDGSVFGNLGGGAFEALVKRDAARKLTEDHPRSELKRYYFTEDAVRGEPTGMVCGGLADVFLEVMSARPLLVICGGGPVGQALAHNGILCDFDLLIVEDRDEFLQPNLFPEGSHCVQVDRDYQGDFLRPWQRRDLFAAVVTRCWETDLAAVQSILSQSPERLLYLGLMGSRRKVARVRQELQERGWGSGAEKMEAPIGIDIAAQSPGEIAVSILAQVIDRKNRAESSSASLVQETQPSALAHAGELKNR